MTERLTAGLAAFFAERIYPAEAEFAADGGIGSIGSPVLTRVSDEVRRRGLWNLFSSLHPARLAVGDPETVDLAEIVGRSPVIGQVAPHSLNPDAAVLELLAALGSAEQASAWLDALADGTISSAYCMTEPGVASSDPRSLRTRGERAADGTVRVTGVKSWCTGAEARNCKILVLLALTEPDSRPAGRYSLVLVRRDGPGVALTNRHDVLGYSDAYRGGHPDIVFTAARGELLGEAGGGLAAAQRILGPARMLHSMRLVGTAERALELMTGRLRSARSAAARSPATICGSTVWAAPGSPSSRCGHWCGRWPASRAWRRRNRSSRRRCPSTWRRSLTWRCRRMAPTAFPPPGSSPTSTLTLGRCGSPMVPTKCTGGWWEGVRWPSIPRRTEQSRLRHASEQHAGGW